MTKYSRKLSSPTKQALSQTPDNENPEMSFLIRIDGALDEDRRSQLEALGFQIRSVTGDIVVVEAHLNDAHALTALEFVSYVEMSGPLYMEEKERRERQ